jgi:hypothetical protein
MALLAGFFGPPNVEQLRRRKDLNGVKGLIGALRYKDSGVRQAAAVALGEERENRLAIDPLAAALGDEEDAVREAAAESLGKLGNKEAADALIATLNDRSASVRAAVVTALGRVGDERAIGPLAALRADSDRHVSSIVDSAIGSIHKRPYLALAEIVASPSGGSHDDALNKLREAANDSYAVDAMMEILARDSWGRHAMAELLVDANVSRALPLLKRLSDRGRFDGYPKMEQRIDELVAAHPETQVPDELVQCALCGKTLAARGATSYGSGANARWFCTDSCWPQRGTVVKELGGCPHLRNGNCSGGEECSMRDGSYVGCHVYRMAHGG